MEAVNDNRRRDFFIKKWLQFKFSLIFVLFIILGNVVFGTYVYRRIKEHLNYYLFTSHSNLNNTWEIIDDVVLQTTFWSVLIFFIAFFLLIYLISHHISNDLHVISDDLEDLKSGNITETCGTVKSETINNLKNYYVDAKCNIKSCIDELKGDIAAINNELSSIEDSIAEKDSVGLPASFDKLDSYYNKLQSTLENIKI